MITNRQIALIHIAKFKVGMTDPEYRALLSGFGVESSTQLRQGQFDSAMKCFAKLGFGRSSTPKTNKHAKPVGQSSRDLLRTKIRKMMAEIGVRDGYVDAMARHMFQVDSWLWLDAVRLRKLVAALTYHRQRRDKRNEHEHGRTA